MQFHRVAVFGLKSVAALALACSLANTASAFQVDAPPVCNNGGPYTFECTGPATQCQLDGTASFDPDGTPVTFFWFEECPFGFFADPTSPTPTYVIDMTGVCTRVCVFELRVTSGNQTVKCNSQVTVNDTQPPVIQCPPDIVEIWTVGPAGGQTDPSLTGFAQASDCDPNPTITYTDTLDPGNAPGEPETIVTRVWTAVDQCLLTSSCTQTITLLSPGTDGQTYYLDAMKGDCPNNLAVSDTAGLFSCTLFGRNGYNVSSIDLTSLQIARLDNVGTTVTRMSIQVKDVGRPHQTDPCDCDGASKDAYNDLVINASRASVINNLDLAAEVGGSVQVVLYGKLTNGLWFTAYDCITIDP
jgi:hypothetical protein